MRQALLVTAGSQRLPSLPETQGFIPSTANKQANKQRFSLGSSSGAAAQGLLFWIQLHLHSSPSKTSIYQEDAFQPD